MHNRVTLFTFPLTTQVQCRRLLFLVAFVPLALSSAYASCHVVTPTGSGSKTGADWSNAYAGPPATLIRGDVYYLADGTYGAYTFNTPPASGTTTVEIRKAQSYDNVRAPAGTPAQWAVRRPYSVVVSIGVFGERGLLDPQR